MSDPETLAVYAAKSEEYASMTGAHNTSDPILAAFMAELPQQAHVLDLGCGPGDSAAVMAAAGMTVHAVDAVAEMIALASRHEGVQAEVATFDQISGTDIYDGIWANYSLLHADREALPLILHALHTALRSGGHFHIAMKTGTATTRDRLGRSYTYVTEEELRDLLVTAGFTVTKKQTGRDKGLDGTYADWIALGADG